MAVNSTGRVMAVVIVCAVVFAGCAAPEVHYEGDRGGGSRGSSSSGRSLGVGLGLGILGAGTSAILGGRSDGQEQPQKTEQTPEEAEKSKNQ